VKLQQQRTTMQPGRHTCLPVCMRVTCSGV